MRLLVLLVWVVSAACSIESEIVVLRAARGRDARLPCGLGRVFLDGAGSYVLWLKNDHDLVYRYPEDPDRRPPVRERSYGQDETTLVLKRVEEADAGLYRCRVHYQAAPSEDYVINVKLVESPGAPRVFQGGEEVTKGYVGPVGLNSDLDLLCETRHRAPNTLVFWRRNGVTVERRPEDDPGRATLAVRGASRGDLNAVFECVAQNADVSEPLVTTVLLKMFLPPMSVEIRLNNNVDFEAGQPRLVDCVVVGCVPPPSVTWHLGDALLRSTVHKELHDGNYTVSSLTLAPSMKDDSRALICRAHNSLLPQATFEDQVVLNVGFRPVCVTSREDVAGVVTGDAERVTCAVDASPAPAQFSWTFADSRTLYTSVKKLTGNRYSSTLTWLPRASDSGLLLCRATNRFGEQKKPCAYSLIQGGAPDEPDCVLIRAYPNTLRVQCSKGWDGGRPQMLHLEMYDDDESLLFNSSDAAGSFVLPDVKEGRNVTALVYASNSRGRSDVRTLHLASVGPLVASAVTEDLKTQWWKQWISATAAVIAVIVTLVSAGLCLMRRRSRPGLEPNPDLVPRTDGTFHREPDFTRDGVHGTTNITVNQLASCPNPYSSSPVPSCRVLVGRTDPCSSTQHSFYV